MRPNSRPGPGWRRLLLLLLVALSGVLALSPALASAPRIGVITMEPGEEFWERFGHDAIVVDDGQSPVSYNFGFFDMGEPGFVGNFVRGRMRYYLVALPLANDLASYAAAGRGVSVQWLDLEPAQARELAAALALNSLPENARYRYDYFTDNCSTRVRDALDRALGGRLRAQLSGRSRGNTWRSESVRLAWPAKWMALGFHLGLAGAADRSLPRWRVPAAVLGLAAALALTLLGRRHRAALGLVALAFWTLAGLLGALMLYLWLGSEHLAAHGNENLLLLSPLSLLLLPAAWRALRGRPLAPWMRAVLWTVAASAAIAGFLKFLPFRPQQNVEWVLLLLPVHLALARAMDPRRS